MTFRKPEAKQEFLGREFTLCGERIIVQEVEAPILDLRLLYVPDEVSNQVVAESLGKYGKVIRVDREMYRNWPEVETGVRVVKLSELSEGIPQKIFVGLYPMETRYRGQVPQCSHCGKYGHRVATCIIIIIITLFKTEKSSVFTKLQRHLKEFKDCIHYTLVQIAVVNIEEHSHYRPYT